MAAYFRRRAAASGSRGALDEPYPALLVSGSADTSGGSDPTMLHEKLYEFTSSAGAADCYDESRDAVISGSRDVGTDDVIDCCARHYQLMTGRVRPPTLDTFRPAGQPAAVDTTTGGGYGECCPLMGVQQRYNGAAAAVLRLHDRHR